MSTRPGSLVQKRLRVLFTALAMCTANPNPPQANLNFESSRCCCRLENASSPKHANEQRRRP